MARKRKEKKPKPHYGYIVHFDEPISHAKHYTGATSYIIPRFWQHLGQFRFIQGEKTIQEIIDSRTCGSRLMQVAVERGIGGIICVFELNGETCFEWEKRVKRRKNISQLCPVCQNGFTHDDIELPAKLYRNIHYIGDTDEI